MGSTFTPENVDAYLATACGLLNEAAGIQKELCIPSAQNLLHIIGEALYACWSAREKIHAFRPDLVPALVSDLEDSPEIYARFVALRTRAQSLELAGELSPALAEYDAFVSSSPSGYCRRVVQLRAALLRSTQNQSDRL